MSGSTLYSKDMIDIRQSRSLVVAVVCAILSLYTLQVDAAKLFGGFERKQHQCREISIEPQMSRRHETCVIALG